MAQFPFSPTGINSKLNELYALTNAELQAQADLIKINFRSWINGAFTLNTTQQNYLLDLSNTAVDYYAKQCAICFVNRLDITVQFPDAPDPGETKWVTTEDNILTLSDGAGNTTISGSFAFSIVYR